MDLTHDAGTQILAELNRIAQGLATMDSLHNPDAPLWDRVGERPVTEVGRAGRGGAVRPSSALDSEGICSPYRGLLVQAPASVGAGTMGGSKADMRLKALAQRASNAAINLDGVTGDSSTDVGRVLL